MPEPRIPTQTEASSRVAAMRYVNGIAFGLAVIALFVVYAILV